MRISVCDRASPPGLESSTHTERLRTFLPLRCLMRLVLNVAKPHLCSRVLSALVCFLRKDGFLETALLLMNKVEAGLFFLL